jgi:uncharacterized protein YfaT (DUF1175 family)
MKLNGVPITVQEFIDIDDASGHQVGMLFANQSPVFMTYMHWIALRREDPTLTWDQYKSMDLDLAAIAECISVEDATPMNGNGPSQLPVSVTSGS